MRSRVCDVIINEVGGHALQSDVYHIPPMQLSRQVNLVPRVCREPQPVRLLPERQQDSDELFDLSKLFDGVLDSNSVSNNIEHFFFNLMASFLMVLGWSPIYRMSYPSKQY